MKESGEWASLLAGGLLGVEWVYMYNMVHLWIAIATGLLLFVCYFTKRRLSNVKFERSRLPPGPAPWPVIGNMDLIAKGGMLLHQTLASLAKEYGPLMTLKLGSYTAVVATSSKMAKEILKTQNHYFCSRPESAAGDIMNYHRMNVVWAPYGEHLRAVRKICQTELLSNKRITSFTNTREEEVLSSVLSMLEASKDGTVPIVLEEWMSQLSTNNVSRMLFGKSFFGRNTEPFTGKKEFMEVVRGVFRLSGIFVVGDFIPALKVFDIGGHEAKMRELALKADKFYTRILEEHRCSTSNISASTKDQTHKQADFLDTLLALPLKDALSETTMKALMADLISAGTDTSANQVCWTFAELMRHPTILKKAVAELDMVVGRDRLLRESDIANLEYLQAIVKESFRLHPVAVLLPYESTQSTFIDGYHIPAKARIFVNNYAISRSEENWEKPLEFMPERFLVSTRDVKGQDFEMMPFGSGRRSCIGMNLGLLMVQLTVAQMLHVCNWSLPPGMEPEDVDIAEDAGISVPMKFPLTLIPTPRLAPSIVNDYVAYLH
ncbi:unnamed protein product [Calypogeia fissa]